ncbi:Inner membrane metabolite transport protein YhjE [Sphingomonas sp. EC-HK361]|uniref:MFS transporter n=1 Tax=Sphingomonas sp. EC-HK361 TaxID=2038397 RepID=UPI001259299F|nr:MFS transporter [Sphingomonas sp. EC-HK361]VVT07648.1 Inner membrane metabolite transport protein YhjE [Sphingomonas sp. EC-HK361]
MSAAVSSRRILTASLVGTAVEFYDFYIYATAAALVFGPLFFPSDSASAQLMLSYASFGLAFVARPVGAIIFGHFGDRLGRKSTLVASLMLMGGSTVAIAFLPTHAQVGWVAPALLCLLRFGQGLGLGGEWGGAALLAVENAPAGRRNTWGMFPPLGAPVGFLAANGFFLLLGFVLTDAQFLAWGWRLPFLASAVLVALGLWVRLKVTETPAFREAAAADALPKVPIATLFAGHARAVLTGTLAVVACFSLFYLATAFALGYGTTALGYSRQAFLAIELVAILFLAAGIIVASVTADRRGARAMLWIGFAGCALAGALMGPMLASGATVEVFTWLALALFVMGFAYGPLGGWLPSLFPSGVRYTGVSVTFNVGGIIGGALAPIAAQALVERGGIGIVGLYLVAAGILSGAGLLILKRGEGA